MAEQQEPVYFDRNRDARATALLSDLRKDLDALAHIETLPGLISPVALANLRERIVELSNRVAEEKRENRERPVRLDPRQRPELVAHFDRRYDVVLSEGSRYRGGPPKTLRDVALSPGATTWQYRSGRSVDLATGRIVEIRPADPTAYPR